MSEQRSISRVVRDAWRKNGPEVKGLLNGAIPAFVTQRSPRDVLDGIPVFCYHLVESEAFAADLEFLSINGYQTLRGRDFVDYLQGNCTLPERSVLLTVDDGPRNFFDVALPLLKRYEARITAFIAPGLHAFAAAEEDTEARPMTWEELAAAHATGLVEFQSHTLESRFVPDWPAPAALSGCKPALEAARRGAPLAFAEDLRRSIELIQSRLPGTVVNQLAFPMYLGNQRATREASAIGIAACYWGLVPGRPLNRAGDSPLAISRVSDEFLRRLPGQGRISPRDLFGVRRRRIQAARAWRARYGG
jgi:peptidoglycan/xylan/chitin deacetylase (PgdA/CDA1 family)